MSKRRCTGIALHPDVAQRILTDHFDLQSANICKDGEKGKEGKLWKLAPRWHELWKHRRLLEDVVDATQGRTLLQSSWKDQIIVYFRRNNIFFLRRRS